MPAFPDGGPLGQTVDHDTKLYRKGGMAANLPARIAIPTPSSTSRADLAHPSLLVTRFLLFPHPRPPSLLVVRTGMLRYVREFPCCFCSFFLGSQCPVPELRKGSPVPCRHIYPSSSRAGIFQSGVPYCLIWFPAPISLRPGISEPRLFLWVIVFRGESSMGGSPHLSSQARSSGPSEVSRKPPPRIILAECRTTWLVVICSRPAPMSVMNAGRAPNGETILLSVSSGFCRAL